ncbi:predicted protein [Chaetomium globosum CBS 148.51]|uniref:Uncharacterized protein n=1 Tax=Chaetomium globosum (strain ATCC 6205 / CBS 148.51 / DSM 1962 / NBRC 6347 / NRRL 1970) TaxID=306901 RepID=Q2HDI9_CHAGB|nr:uncharacterized protein CHGG_01715 [Chaetomium globosum CBS 148.51]EAQ93480.1 predicted protein [Chaetomium globosum CBS 148.51]
MKPSRPSDQSLLDRLNALKSTGVTLDKPANIAILPVADAQPSSKEDALAARLRILRSQSSSSSRDGASAGAPPPGSPPPKEGGTKRVSPAPEGPKDHSQKRPPIRSAEFEAADEEALDELLGALGDEEFDLAADEDAVPPPDLDPRDEARRVSDLLETLGKKAGGPASNGPSNTEGDDDDDNSDGEQMTRDVDTLLSQIRDEINSLPPPSTATPQDGDEEAPITLPTVPSQLVDPAPDPHGDEDALEQDLAARMASLRGLGPPTSASDPLGLPSAPTFRPQDRTGNTGEQRLGGSSKYTDADQKTW